MGSSTVGAASTSNDVRQIDAKSLKAVLFDVDGTLAHSDPIHFRVFREMLVEKGFREGKPIDESFFNRNISGRSNDAITRDFFPTWTDAEREHFTLEKEGKYREEAAVHLEPVEGLEQLCTYVKERGLKCAAVTNAPRKNAELMLGVLGLSNFFDLVVIGDECKRAKPFPDPYQKALHHFGIEPHEAFVIEDSTSGLSAAVAADIPAIGICTSLKPEELLAVGACMTIDDYRNEGFWAMLSSPTLNDVQ